MRPVKATQNGSFWAREMFFFQNSSIKAQQRTTVDVFSRISMAICRVTKKCEYGFVKVCRSYSRKSDFEQIHITLTCIMNDA